jgi:hypothetical protein
MNSASINKLSILINLLEQHSKIHILSVALTLSAIIFFTVSTLLLNNILVITVLNLTVIITGLYETYLAIRVGFDLKLFKRLTLPNVNIEDELKLIDAALLELKLIPNSKSARELDVRVQGVSALFKKQAVACLAQFIGIFIIAYLFYVIK